MRLINIGFGNMISSARLVTIVSPDSAPIKRIVQDARDRGRLIDATYGRRTRAVIVMDSDHVILSAIQPETIAARLADDVMAELTAVSEIITTGEIRTALCALLRKKGYPLTAEHYMNYQK